MVTKKTGWMVKVMNIAICDDERNFAKMLKDYISEYAALHDFTNHVELYFSPTQLLQADLSKIRHCFLDIEMPGIDGIETARQLRQQYDELLLVFITGWIKYAPDGYRVNAFRYLLKKSLARRFVVMLRRNTGKVVRKYRMYFITKQRTRVGDTT